MKPTTKRKPTKVTPTDAPKPKQMKGFAVMKPAQRSKIASMGGLAVSKDRKYMARLGRKGGLRSHVNTNSKSN